MDIEVEKIMPNPIHNSALISISDEMILAIGKRYFELASGKDEPKETSKLDTVADIFNKAKDIKTFCSEHKSCRGCPLFVQDGMVWDCVFRTPPGDWEV